jgi:hypothetical protein
VLSTAPSAHAQLSGYPAALLDRSLSAGLDAARRNKALRFSVTHKTPHQDDTQDSTASAPTPSTTSHVGLPPVFHIAFILMFPAQLIQQASYSSAEIATPTDGGSRSRIAKQRRRNDQVLGRHPCSATSQPMRAKQLPRRVFSQAERRFTLAACAAGLVWTR